MFNRVNEFQECVKNHVKILSSDIDDLSIFEIDLDDEVRLK